jgi:hypothetical protein
VLSTTSHSDGRPDLSLGNDLHRLLPTAPNQSKHPISWTRRVVHTTSQQAAASAPCTANLCTYRGKQRLSLRHRNPTNAKAIVVSERKYQRSLCMQQLLMQLKKRGISPNRVNHTASSPSPQNWRNYHTRQNFLITLSLPK